MLEVVIRVIVNAIALWAAAVFVPNISFPAAEKFPNENPAAFLLIALVFGLVNAYIKPIVKTLAIPLTLVMIGLVGFLINAAMLLLTAFISDALKITFKLGGFPPDVTINTIVAAILGAIVISIVSTVLTLVTIPVRRRPF